MEAAGSKHTEGTRMRLTCMALVLSASCGQLLEYDDVTFVELDGGVGEAGSWGNDSGSNGDGQTGGAAGEGGVAGSGAEGGVGGSAGSTGGTGTSGEGGIGGGTGGTGGSTGGTGGSTGGTGGTGGTTGSCDSGPGKEMVDLLNDYRIQNGLAPIPCSPSLMTVSEAHVHDLYDNQPHAPATCNLHSWSDKGPWTACCYTSDHAQAQCMWDKPRELTVYPGNGYENAASGVSTPSAAINAWKNSSAHNAVMLNEGIWSSHPWRAVGAGLYGGYAVLWFGRETDPG